MKPLIYIDFRIFCNFRVLVSLKTTPKVGKNTYCKPPLPRKQGSEEMGNGQYLLGLITDGEELLLKLTNFYEK